jgi:hypothetical protein
MPTSTIHSKVLLHVVNLRYGTDGFTSPHEGRRGEDFFVLKNPTVLAGFEPANLGNKDKTLLLDHRSR